MKRNTVIVLIVLAVIFIGVPGCSVLWGVSTYNKVLVPKDEAIDAQWANVETAYQRRADLIPNLVATVKGYADFEQETLTAVIEARSKATSMTIDPSNLDASSIAQFQAVQDELSSSLSRLLVTIERYPDLKANQNFLELQSQLEGTENRIAVERRKFNESVQGLNTVIRKFPVNIVANIANIDEGAYFKSDEGSQKAPDVSFE